MSELRLSLNTLARLGALAGMMALAAGNAVAGSSPDIGVSVSIAQPGFYGRVDIGNQQPALIYPQPVIIQQSPVAVYQRPIYMRVPPGHSKNWARYCGQYRACGQPVYFIRDDAPRYAPQPGWDQHHDHDRGYDDDRRGDDDRGDRGRGHGRGHGHGHGH